MHKMQTGIRQNLLSKAGLLAIGLVLVNGAEALDLAAAEALALRIDPSVAALQSRRSALNEMEVAAGQLPDPALKFGLLSAPTDTFHLGQEAMTQVQLGLVQTFPRGQTRSLRAAKIRERAGAIDERSRDLGLRIKLAVREAFLEVLKQQRLAEVNHEAEQAFTDLEEITQDYYATGRVQQQDVLRAAVELAKVRERSVRIDEQEQAARGQLAAWIGEAAWRELDADWPRLDEPSPSQAIKQGLAGHPHVLALHREVLAAEKDIDLAKQNYKPEFALDLTYGGRGGRNPDGSSRSDLLSFMVRMDLPLFAARRQDRLAAASIANSSAAAFDRDDAHRRLGSQVDVYFHTRQGQLERLSLYETSLLPEADFNARATLDAYQAALEDMTTLTRARITEFDLQLDYSRLKAESLKSQARLLYLEGK